MSHNRIDTNRHTSSAALRKTAQANTLGRAPQASAGEHPLGESDAVSTASGGALDAVRGETGRIDAARLSDLSDKIDRGEYKVDAGELAERILDDALGTEGG